MTKKIAIVIPAYQCAKTIKDVFMRISEDVLKKEVHFIVVNDGSEDDTEQIVRSLMNLKWKITLITHPVNRGYAQAQKTGFKAALDLGADIIAVLHSDGQYAPELLPQLLEPLEMDTADVVQGSRMKAGGALKGGMPLYKYLANSILSKIENMAYGMNFAEYHSGYMLYSRKTLLSIPFEKLSDTFHFDGEMLLMSGKRKLRVNEIAISTYYGNEKSHLKPIKYGFDVLKIIWDNFCGRYDF